MPRKLITAADGLRACIFHDDGTGLRGVTLLRSSGVRGQALSVAVHEVDGKRRAVNTFSLKGVDFYSQWKRAVDTICRHYRIAEDSEIYNEMIAAAAVFILRYKIRLHPVVVTYQQAVMAEAN